MGNYLIGLVWVFISVSSITMTKFRYNDMFVGFIGFCYLIFGSICGLLLVKLFEKKLDLGIKIINLVLLFGWAQFIFIDCYFDPKSDIKDNGYFTTCVVFNYLLLGGSFLAAFGMMLNSCLKVCYPIQESISTGNI